MLYVKTLLLLALVSNSFSECHLTNDRNIFLWSVSNPTTFSHGYLFGTIHVPYTDVWDRVSDRVREAFSFSDTVLFEVDLHDENTLRKLIKCKNLRRKQTVRTYLSTELYDRISNFMAQFRNNLLLWAQKEESYGIDSYKRAQEIYDSVAGNWDRKRPEWLLFALYQLCENLVDRSTSPMLDMFLAQKALEEDKKIHAIETAHEQCNPVVSLSQNDIIFAINYTMYYLEHLHAAQELFTTKKQRSIKELVESYRCGNLEERSFDGYDLSRIGFQIGTNVRSKAMKIDGQLREDIITKRNTRMAQRLHRLMGEYPKQTVFSAIGTGHFFGNESIVEHLREMGYVVQRIKDGDIISPPYHERKDHTFNSLWTKEHSKPEVLDVSIEFIELNSSYSLPMFFPLSVFLSFHLEFYKLFTIN